MEEDRKIYSLYQLNRSLENHIMAHFSTQDFWITAELIRLNQKNGHFYLELADSEKEQVVARSQGVIWASRYRSIVEEVGLQDLMGILQPGNRVLMNVKIEFHSIYGLKLKIRHIDPTYSYGEIERKKKAVIERLKKEGLFDKQQKLKLPTIIKRIALIGSPNTSGFRDFLNELFNNHDFRQFAIKEFPVSVQGKGAVDGIVNAIRSASQHDADVIVLLRGGGSKMDLALFDEYAISEAICLSRLPVMTGIGHETDEVVADLVAKIHFITPTAVGQYIQYEIKSFQEILRAYHDKATQLSLQLFGKEKENFLHLNNYLSLYSREIIHFWQVQFEDQKKAVFRHARTILFDERDNLAENSHQVVGLLQHEVQTQRNELRFAQSNVYLLSKQSIESEKQLLNHQWRYNLVSFARQCVEQTSIQLSNLSDLLTLLNPLRMLKAGYTISTVKDKDVQSVKLMVGDELKTLSSNQYIISKVTEIKEIKNEN